MIPRDPRCDNDDCYEDENPATGGAMWVHVDDCDAEELPLLTREQAAEMIRNAPPNSFLANINLGGPVL